MEVRAPSYFLLCVTVEKIVCPYFLVRCFRIDLSPTILLILY